MKPNRGQGTLRQGYYRHVQILKPNKQGQNNMVQFGNAWNIT